MQISSRMQLPEWTGQVPQLTFMQGTFFLRQVAIVDILWIRPRSAAEVHSHIFCWEQEVAAQPHTIPQPSNNAETTDRQADRE